jgi:hypothetical protein
MAPPETSSPICVACLVFGPVEIAHEDERDVGAPAAALARIDALAARARR